MFELRERVFSSSKFFVARVVRLFILLRTPTIECPLNGSRSSSHHRVNDKITIFVYDTKSYVPLNRHLYQINIISEKLSYPSYPILKSLSNHDKYFHLIGELFASTVLMHGAIKKKKLELKRKTVLFI